MQFKDLNKSVNQGSEKSVISVERVRKETEKMKTTTTTTTNLEDKMSAVSEPDITWRWSNRSVWGGQVTLLPAPAFGQ